MNKFEGLDGKIVLITGAGGALGSAVAEVFAASGATIAEPVVSGHGRLDVTQPEQVDEAVRGLIAAHGRIHVLINTVGAWAPQPPVAELDDETFDRLMNVNLRSVFVMCRAVLGHMIENRYGRIVNVGAKQALKNSAGNAAYGAAKAGVVSLTQAIAEEGAPYGVTCNVVIPSIIDTPANRAGMPDADFTSWVAPSHIAETMAFLCTPAGGNINGAAIPVWNRS